MSQTVGMRRTLHIVDVVCAGNQGAGKHFIRSRVDFRSGRHHLRLHVALNQIDDSRIAVAGSFDNREVIFFNLLVVGQTVGFEGRSDPD